ncbi:DEP domain-containing protein 1B-like isoform X2 [Saccoglossus kowalevskii]|uniref:DEP domain-containing protein 1B-like isoform X2 n=1 Tax=Saccoglossus kowalevskii TaxID=10224 RepID=A0ABM0M848_SACKO|nr:PREDICTED: DEP domain-containing protein 1B-like isoform X2 [Saccoglossus kowalevskii]
MLQQGGPTMGPFRATRLWNDLIQVFRSGMPLKKHRWRVRLYDNCFTASDAVDWLHDHLRANINFGPEVTRQQTIQLLRKFVKSNIIHEVRRKEYKETVFEDDGHLFRFTRTSPTKVLQPSSVLSSRTNLQQSPSKSQPPLTITNLQQSPMKVGKRLPECKLVMKTITQYDIEDAWKTMTLASLQKILGLSTLEELISSEKIIAKHVIHNANNVNKNGIVTLLNKEEDLPYWVLSAMRCLANWPNRLDDGLPSYPGFERDVFKSVTDYFQSLPEPLLTYEYYDLFTNVLGLYATDSSCAQDALQLCCMMLPPSNRKKLHLLLRMMSKMENNEELNLVDGISTRQLVLQTFSRCILSCMQEVGLDEILAMRLVTYMMDNYIEILKVPEQLRNDVEQRIAYLRRGKIKYSDEENAYAYCEQVSKEEYEKQKLSNSQDAIAELLEGIIKDRQMPVKEKRKKLRQFQRAYPNIYAKRLPTTASEAELFPEKPTIKQPMLSMVKPFSRRRNNMRY